MFSCTSAKLPKPSTKLITPFVADTRMSRTNKDNKDNNQDPNLDVLPRWSKVSLFPNNVWLSELL